MTPGTLRALLCLSEMAVCRGGMAGLVRNSLFPSCEEMSALAAQFGLSPGGSDLREPDPSPRPEGEGSRSRTPVLPGYGTGEVRRRERRRVKVPLDMENRRYERLLCERRQQKAVDHINKNIVSFVTDNFTSI